MSRASIVAFALLCALCCCAPSTFAVSFADCGSKLGRFLEVSVSNCSTVSAECSLVRGTNASIDIKFIPNVNISQVGVRVYGVLIDIPIPFPFGQPDACKDPNSGIKCPLQENQEYNYKTTLFVQKKFPSVKVDIKWELVDKKNNNIICIQFPAKVK